MESDESSRSPKRSRSRSLFSNRSRTSSVDSSLSDRERSSLSALKRYVKNDIKLQTDNVIFRLDQKAIFAEMRKKYKNVKRMSDAYVPGARARGDNFEHLCACPCSICVSLEHTLDKEDSEPTLKVRGFLNWVPNGQTRPLCLLLRAAVPGIGEQPGPFAFCGPKTILEEINNAFGAGLFLHSTIAHRKKVNSSPNLSSQWIGGPKHKSCTATSTSQSVSNNNIENGVYTIPKIAKDLTFVRDGPKFFQRSKMTETCAKPAKYQASTAAMEVASDLMVMSKNCLEKRVKKWSQENLMLPPGQWDQIKVPVLPQRFNRYAKLDGPARVKENALMSVGSAVNYTLLGGIRLSESVSLLDALIPELETSTASLDSLQPPVYVPPSDLDNLDQIKTSLQTGQKLFADMDPGTRVEVLLGD